MEWLAGLCGLACLAGFLMLLTPLVLIWRRSTPPASDARTGPVLRVSRKPQTGGAEWAVVADGWKIDTIADGQTVHVRLPTIRSRVWVRYWGVIASNGIDVAGSRDEMFAAECGKTSLATHLTFLLLPLALIGEFLPIFARDIYIKATPLPAAERK